METKEKIMATLESIKYFSDLVKENEDILWNVNNPIPFEYCDLDVENPFNYSNKRGGTVDSFKYYNNYVVIINKKNSHINN